MCIYIFKYIYNNIYINCSDEAFSISLGIIVILFEFKFLKD